MIVTISVVTSDTHDRKLFQVKPFRTTWFHEGPYCHVNPETKSDFISDIMYRMTG